MLAPECRYDGDGAVLRLGLQAHALGIAYDSHKSLGYKLGELLRNTSDHMLLLTATPHKGDPQT